LNMTKRSIIVFVVTFALLGVSICFNVWQTSKLWELNSEIDELKNLREPMVHLIYYEWKVIVINWEHEYVQVNYTLFNSGSTRVTQMLISRCQSTSLTTKSRLGPKNGKSKSMRQAKKRLLM
jgi:hypothetical protein